MMRKYVLNFVLLFFCCFALEVRAQQISIIVNKDNPVQVISDKDLSHYYLKTKRMWPHGLKVNPIDFTQSMTEKKFFLKEILQFSEAEWQAHWVKAKETKFVLPPLIIATARQAIELVAFDKSAIAYVYSHDLVEQDLKKVTVVRTLE